MEWLWNWGGECFGYRNGDDLWTYNGKHVGRFEQSGDVYGTNGRYLGEIMTGRLITARSKASHRSGSFAAYGRRAGYARYAGYAGYAMYAGYEDFPSADSF